MSTSSITSYGGTSVRRQADTFRAVTDQKIEQLTDEQLECSTEQLQTAVKQLQLETDVLERFLQRVDPGQHTASVGGGPAVGGRSSVQSTTPSLSPAQSASDVSTSHQSTHSVQRTVRRAGKQSSKGRSGFSGGTRGVATARLTPEQCCDIASRELEELNDALRQEKNQHQCSLQNLRVVLEAADARLKEIQNVTAIFERDVITGAVSGPRSSRVMSEKVQRHFDELNKTRDAVLEKLHLKNANTKNMIQKMEAQMRQKEEMGDVLRQVDFDQLKIENQQFLDHIEHKNSTMIQLKLLAGRSLLELDQQKRKLQALTEMGQRLGVATQKERATGRRVKVERTRVERQLSSSGAVNERLRAQVANYRVPPTIDYMRTNDRVYKLKRKVVIWQRKLDIAKMALLNLRTVPGIKSERATERTNQSGVGSGVTDHSETNRRARWRAARQEGRGGVQSQLRARQGGVSSSMLSACVVPSRRTAVRREMLGRATMEESVRDLQRQ